MEFIECVQGQAKGLREQLVLVPTSEGSPQDVWESFGVQEDQESLHLAPKWEQSTLESLGGARHAQSLETYVFAPQELIRHMPFFRAHQHLLPRLSFLIVSLSFLLSFTLSFPPP